MTRFVCIFALLMVSEQATASTTASEWSRVVALLQYLEVDYPAALAGGVPEELEEQREFSAEAVRLMEELGPAASAYLPRLRALQADIAASKDPATVSAELKMLVDEIVESQALARSPSRMPDLELGRRLYAQSCASCHGADGAANTPLASTMEPQPRSFLSEEVMGGLSPYRAFNAISFGVTGTAMPSFELYDEDQRWNLAFFLFTLRHPPCPADTAPRAALQELAVKTDAELEAERGKTQLGCLRAAPRTLTEEESLLAAREGVAEAQRRFRQGDRTGTQRALLDAYLNGLEPAEPLLRARSPALVVKLESAFLQARRLAQGDAAAFERHIELLGALIDEARRGTKPAGARSVFSIAALIVLREGFEALVVVGALLALLKKLDQRRQARLVHLGWVSALVVGAVAFWLGQRLLAGANREWVEGLVALVAVVLLLYAALWLNARANIRKFMGELRARMQGALGRGSAVGLFVVSFTAVVRESFETAVFLQGLSIDAPRAAALGGATGLVLVGVLAFAISRVGYRLPMKALFDFSTGLLIGTAVVMLGKGIHALQEAGAILTRPFPMLQVELLGLYPDAVSFLPQLALTVAAVVWWIRTRSAPAGSDAPAPG